MWEETRNEPLRTFKWGVDSLLDVKFNPVQKDLLGIIHIYIEVSFYFIYFSSSSLCVQNFELIFS